MNKNKLEKYVGELSPEMQEKARQCKDMQELNALLAENDIELSDDALEAVAGGCSQSSSQYNQGDEMWDSKCPICGNTLRYWDMCAKEKGYASIFRMYCANSSCSSYNNGLWYRGLNSTKIQKY